MKKTNNKRKHYFLAGVMCLGILAISCSHIATSRAIESISSSDYNVPQDIPMKDWVLNEVRKAGIDEYKVWALVNCESRWNADASLINYSGRQGVDRGLFQINDKYHPEVSNACSYDYKCATKEAIRIIKKHGFKEWVCAKKLGL
jgi:hypothetical protein